MINIIRVKKIKLFLENLNVNLFFFKLIFLCTLLFALNFGKGFFASQLIAEEPGKKDQETKSSESGEEAKQEDGELLQAKGAEDVEEAVELVNMDFPELTDIKDIIKAVALWTGKNVILDRNVTGKIQIISPKKVTKEPKAIPFTNE